MANADSTIRVNIIGDAKSLQAAIGTADKSIGGLAASTKGLLAGAAIGGATAAVVEFGTTALNEADRVGDALTRLEGQLGTELTTSIDRASDGFTKLGQSRQDVLELAAAHTDMATALGLADDQIASFAPKVAETAAAMSLITDTDAATVVDQIGKAAGGSDRALRALGVNLSDAAVEARALQDTGKDTPDMLTKSEKAAAAYALILEQLAPRLQDVTDGTGDFESKTAELDAKLETLTGKIGGHIEGPLTDLLDWTLKGITGWEMLAERIGDGEKSIDGAAEAFDLALLPIKALVFPLGLVGDAIDRITGSAKAATRSLTEMYQNTPNPDRRDASERQIIQQIRDYERRNSISIL